MWGNTWGKWVLNGVHAVQENFGIERGCKKRRIEQHGVFFLTGLQRATWRDGLECSSKSLAWAQILCSPLFIAFFWTHPFRLLFWNCCVWRTSKTNYLDIPIKILDTTESCCIIQILEWSMSVSAHLSLRSSPQSDTEGKDSSTPHEARHTLITWDTLHCASL